MKYSINIDSSVSNIFSSLNENRNSFDQLNNELFGYYCSKIYDETQAMYFNFTNFDNFEKDLFIEQSKPMFFMLKINKIILKIK